MSVRIHVVAARDVSAAEFKQALPCAPFHFGSSGPWQWAQGSVWKVGGGEIDQALASLPGPALRTTTSDGALWTLSVTGAGHKLFRGVHFFTSVGSDWQEDEVEEPEEDEDFPEHEPEEAAGVSRYVPELQFLWDEEEAAKDQIQSEREAAERKNESTDYGVELPSHVLEQMQRESHSAAQRTAFVAHAEQIVAALAQRGFDFDHDAVLKLLTVGPLTEREDGSELGNLPRFLDHLGIVGWIAEPAEDPPNTTAQNENKQLDDQGKHGGREKIDAVEALMQDRPAVPISGGPVKLALHQVVHLHLISRYCDVDDGPAMIVLQPRVETPVLPDEWKQLGHRDVELQRDGPTWKIGFNLTPWFFETEERNDLEDHELVRALSTITCEAQLELIQSVGGPKEACHRYAGILRDGTFHLEATYPQLDAATLSEALDLLRLTIGTKSIPLDNKDEERRVRRAYQDDIGEEPRIKNGKIKPDYGERHYIVRCKFFSRFRERGVWDIAGVEARQEESDAAVNEILSGGGPSADDAIDANDEQLMKLKAMVDAVKAAKLAPRSDHLLFAGTASKFYQAAMTDLENVRPEDLASKDRAMEALGFGYVTDMVADFAPEGIGRCYAGPENAIAIYERRRESNRFAFNSDGVMIDFSRGVHEFHTHFADGSILVTNDVYGASSDPQKRIFVRVYEDISLDELWNKHLDGIARLVKQRGTQPIDHAPGRDPQAYAALMDSLYARLKGSA